MELFQAFDTVLVQDFNEATAAIVGLTHGHPNCVDFFDLSQYTLSKDQPGMMRFLTGEEAPTAVIQMLKRLEETGTLQELAIFAHSTLYYLLRLHWPAALEILTHDPDRGYVAKFLGHHFFAHSKIREDAILVGGLRGSQPVSIIGSRNENIRNIPLLLG